MDNTYHRKRNDYKIDMAIDTFWHESIFHKIGKVLFYAYIGITGWFFMHWAMLKLSKGQGVGPLKERWYHFAKNMSIVALPMYGVEVDKAQYDSAMATLVDCKLEDLSFLNHEFGVYEEVK